MRYKSWVDISNELYDDVIKVICIQINLIFAFVN